MQRKHWQTLCEEVQAELLDSVSEKGFETQFQKSSCRKQLKKTQEDPSPKARLHQEPVKTMDMQDRVSTCVSPSMWKQTRYRPGMQTPLHSMLVDGDHRHKHWRDFHTLGQNVKSEASPIRVGSYFRVYESTGRLPPTPPSSA